MCRMLAFASDEPRDGAPYLAALSRFSLSGNLLKRFAVRPGGNHPDGWGVAYRDPSGIRLVRGGMPAGSDPLFAKLSFATDRFIGHVRYASNPATVNAANAHPFRAGGIVLAHNGTFKGAVGKEGDARNVSDTLVFLERLAGAWSDPTLAGLADALSAMLSDRKLVGAYSAANMLIGSGASLFALRDCRKDPDYYTLWLRTGPGETIASSEPLGERAGWRPLENGELVDLSRPRAGSLPVGTSR